MHYHARIIPTLIPCSRPLPLPTKPENAMGWILISMTFLGGSAWGPQIAMGAFETKALCEAGAKATHEMFASMSKTNIAGGRSQRDILSARCVPSASTSKQ